MAKAKRYIPEGLQPVTPSLVVDGAAQAIDWYRKVFGASERGKRHLGPEGRVMHAELQIGSSVLFLNDTMRGAPNVVQDGRRLGGSPVALTVLLRGLRRGVQASHGERRAGDDADRRSVLGRPLGELHRSVRSELERGNAPRGPDAGRAGYPGAGIFQADGVATEEIARSGRWSVRRNP